MAPKLHRNGSKTDKVTMIRAWRDVPSGVSEDSLVCPRKIAVENVVDVVDLEGRFNP